MSDCIKGEKIQPYVKTYDKTITLFTYWYGQGINVEKVYDICRDNEDVQDTIKTLNEDKRQYKKELFVETKPKFADLFVIETCDRRVVTFDKLEAIQRLATMSNEIFTIEYYEKIMIVNDTKYRKM